MHVILKKGIFERDHFYHSTITCRCLSEKCTHKHFRFYWGGHDGPKSQDHGQDQDFLALVDSFNLKQHVCSPTHHAGHILDLLITRDDDQLVTSVSIHDAAFSDHFVVNCALSLEKPPFTRKQIILVLRILILIFDIRSSSLLSDPPNELDDLVARYDSELSGIFNRHLPIKKRTVTIRPVAPWYSEELKREKRRLERWWRASRSMRDHEAYMRQCKVLKD